MSTVEKDIKEESEKITKVKKIVLFEHNKTGKWLADQLGKSPCTVSKWCLNTIQPDLLTLDKISKTKE